MNIIEFLLEPTSLLLIGAGVVVSLFGTLIGGSQFLAVPIFQVLFPGANFGTIIGNFKVGSFFRGIGSTITTWDKIEWKNSILLALPPMLFSILGATFIAKLDQKWIFPAIIFAVILAELAPKYAHKITKKSFWGASLFSGLYAGFLGAGIGILLVALLRVTHPKDDQIAVVKIQARFIELLLVISTVVAHFYHGNLLFKIWFPWAIGTFVGGLFGGKMLKGLIHLSGNTQKLVLRISFALAIIIAGIKFFGYI